jgi:phosphorylase kinase alpha/beta subunit
VGTVGSGHATEFSKPFSPLEIRTALYSSVAPVDVMGAVLQQELILACGKLIETRPDLFRGMLVLRMGWLLQAMEVLQACGGAERPAPLASLSPHRLRSVLVAVLQETAGGRSGRLLTHTQLSTLNGCLARVPEGFYDGVFLTLQRCRGGITFRDRHLPHLPTVLLADPTELAFSHLVDSHLATGYPEPRHRGLTVRLLAILATVLHRNPELRLDDGELVLEEVLESARALREPGGEGGRAWRDLSQAEVDSYLARAVGNLLLGGRHGREDLPCKMQ